MAEASTTLRLGTCVTNPATREPSVTASSLAVLDEVSGGRMDLGIGRGDSARRVLGKPPTTMATLEEAIRVIRALVAGETIGYEGTDLHFPWTSGWTLPVWVAGYGPMALAMTGRVADGLILQLADPDLIAWFVGQLRDAEAAAGRPAGSVKVQSAAPAHVGDLADCRERTRWFPALVSNHVVDLVSKYPREQLPEALTGYVHDREGYDYLHHAEVGSSNARFVGDDVTDRFCVIGLGRGPRRQAREARRRRRRPVQHLPDERRRGADPRGLRERDHPRRAPGRGRAGLARGRSGMTTTTGTTTAAARRRRAAGSCSRRWRRASSS